MQIGTRKPRKRLRLVAVVVLLVALSVGLWLALRVGPLPAVELSADRPAVGRATTVTAGFSEPVNGLEEVRLELVQGDRTELLARDTLVPGSLLPWSADGGTAEAVLSAVVGTDVFDWLAEDELVVRAVASRSAGFLRRPDPVVVERTLPVRLRPPRLELVSSQHYGRQGGSGAVAYRVGTTAVRSGVRAGSHESRGFHQEGGGADEFFALYALPWDLDDESAIRLFAEDDAGNRIEIPFLDLFKTMPARIDTIELSDAFLERVVPAIADRTPGFEVSGSLLDQYLVINGELRRAELDRIASLAELSEPGFLWSGPFLQMPNSALKANFAQVRTYLYQGGEVDRQTHLGLDLASTAHAPVPAPNSGRVVVAGWMTLFGNAVVIDHGYGLMSLCGHLSTVDVAVGDEVERGQILGTSGATGLAGGDHLHLEVFLHGQSVDPLEWLDEKWIRDNLGTKMGVPLD